MPPIVLVAAIARNGVIGTSGQLPWHLPADLQHFKKVTLGRPMIMGRKTYESIGRPLPGRRTIVVTRDRQWAVDGVETADSLDAALEMAADRQPEEIIIAGGGEIYSQAIGRADLMRLTWIELEPDGDARFPDFDSLEWSETGREAHPAEGDRAGFVFVDYVRRRGDGATVG